MVGVRPSVPGGGNRSFTELRSHKRRLMTSCNPFVQVRLHHKVFEESLPQVGVEYVRSIFLKIPLPEAVPEPNLTRSIIFLGTTDTQGVWDATNSSIELLRMGVVLVYPRIVP